MSACVLIRGGNSSPKGLLGKQDVQCLSVIGVSLSVKEDPVFLQQNLRGRVYETWFSVVWGVENLPSHLVGGSEDNEARNQLNPSIDLELDLHVEDRDCRESSRVPLLLII